MELTRRFSKLVIASLTAALAAAGCQDVQTFVTGDQFSAAPENSPRVEVEVVVDVPDSFYDSLEGKEARELDQAIRDRVLGLADIGMRLYPVPTESYGKGDAHPPYKMSVQVKELLVEVDHKMVEEDGAEPRIEASVRGVGCSAATVIEKRREGGPSLVVGRSNGVSQIRSSRKQDNASVSTKYPVVQAKGDDAQDLWVSREEVLQAVERAVVLSLRELTEPIDRDLAVGSDAKML